MLEMMNWALKIWQTGVAVAGSRELWISAYPLDSEFEVQLELMVTSSVNGLLWMLPFTDFIRDLFITCSTKRLGLVCKTSDNSS